MLKAVPMHLPDFQEIVPIIKRLLKEKGITYRDLAKPLGLSESSVKKLFIARDCSLSRLNQICEVLEVGLNDLIQFAGERTPEVFRFKPEQEAFLVKDRDAFRVYWKLVYERQPQAQIMRDLNLSQATLFKILRSLDQVGVIELLPEGKVRFPETDMLLWAPDGALAELAKKIWAPLIVRKVGEKAGSVDGYAVALRHFTLLPESLVEFRQAFEALFAEFGRRSVRETRLRGDRVERLYVAASFSPTCFIEEL